MKFSVITLFPEAFESIFSSSILARALKKELITLNFVNLRDFGIGAHRSVDDRPYGGGTGMVIRVDVVEQAIESTREGSKEKVILLDPAGKTYTQTKAETYSRLDHIILICGHYEGFDARIRDYVDEVISIGDFVLSGGEIAAMAIIESTSRLIHGVIPKEEATNIESFSSNQGKRILEYPQYTRPQEYKGKKIPEILLGGDHKKIEEFRKNEAIKLTKKMRPDILKKN